MNVYNIPEEPGLYFANRHKNYRGWELIVKVYGPHPFLKCKSWNISSRCHKVETIIRPQFLFFGPKIEIPKNI